jgi:hypothetical protein
MVPNYNKREMLKRREINKKSRTISESNIATILEAMTEDEDDQEKQSK